MLTHTDMTAPLAAMTEIFATLSRLADLHPDLPGAYITASQITPHEAHVLLDGPADLEAWRVATHTDSADVALTEREDDRKLLFTAPLGHISIRVYTVFPTCGEAVHA
ncbi:hypothetical protein [Streptomyces sp. NPDC090022]|uniref:hypothetical protein n=1 Tax=Streptomyces sp. NPDC090022 TaxID=3365920 RepID=UPI0038126DCC